MPEKIFRAVVVLCSNGQTERINDPDEVYVSHSGALVIVMPALINRITNERVRPTRGFAHGEWKRFEEVVVA